MKVLKKLNLTVSEVLSPEKQKYIFGGYGGYGDVASCTAKCNDDCSVSCSGTGTCIAVEGKDGYCSINGVVKSSCKKKCK